MIIVIITKILVNIRCELFKMSKLSYVTMLYFVEEKNVENVLKTFCKFLKSPRIFFTNEKNFTWQCPPI